MWLHRQARLPGRLLVGRRCAYTLLSLFVEYGRDRAGIEESEAGVSDTSDELLPLITEQQRVLIVGLRKRVERAEAEAALIRDVADKVVHFWLDCEEVTPMDTAVRDLVAVLRTGAGQALLAELTAARAVVELLQERRRQSGRCYACSFGTKLNGEEFHGSGCVVAAYQQAVKARGE